MLLHGLGGSRISWEPQLEHLAERRRVVAWDLPGYGDAPPLADDRGGELPVTFATLADAVVRFVDDVVGEGAVVHLAGISFGGMIAQYAAARHPHRFVTLALLATSPKFGLDGTDPAEWRAARLAPLDAGEEPADFADRVLSHLAGPDIEPAAFAGQRDAMARVSAAALRRSIECLVHHDSRAVLASITAPTLCLVGELDRETPPEYSRAIAAQIPGAEVVVVPSAGHLLNAEAPAAVDELLDRHIREHRSAR